MIEYKLNFNDFPHMMYYSVLLLVHISVQIYQFQQK